MKEALAATGCAVVEKCCWLDEGVKVRSINDVALVKKASNLERCTVGDGSKAVLVPPHEIPYLLEMVDDASKLALRDWIKDADVMYAIVHAAEHFAFLQVDLYWGRYGSAEPTQWTAQRLE